MEYLSGKPFSVGGYSAAYAERFDAVFRQKPSMPTRHDAAPGGQGDVETEEVGARPLEAQGAMLPVPPVEEAGEAVFAPGGDPGRVAGAGRAGGEALNAYRVLQTRLVAARAAHANQESRGEDGVLDEMDDLWWKRTDKERAVLDDTPPAP